MAMEQKPTHEAGHDEIVAAPPPNDTPIDVKHDGADNEVDCELSMTLTRVCFRG